MVKRNSRKLLKAVLLPLAAIVVLTVCSPTESYAQSQVACELSKMNVLYVGLDNPLIIAASEYSVNDLEITITNGQINGLAGKYTVRPAKPGVVELKVNAKGKTLGSRTFRALLTPDPQACILLKEEGEKNFISKGKVTVKQLAEIEKIHAKISDFLFDIDYKVVEFKINVTGNGGVNLLEKSNSDMLTKHQKSILKRLKSGQWIFIEDIKAIGPDGMVRDLNDIELKVI